MPRGAVIVPETRAAYECRTAKGFECLPPQAVGLGPHIRTQAREQIRHLAQRLLEARALDTDDVPLTRLLWDPLFRALTPLMTALYTADLVLTQQHPAELLVPIAPSRPVLMQSLDHLDGLTVAAQALGLPCQALWPPDMGLGRLLPRLWRLWRLLAGSRLLIRGFLCPRFSPQPRPASADFVLSPWSAAELASLRPVAAALLEAGSTVAAVESPFYYAASRIARPEAMLPRYLLGRFSRAADWWPARRTARAVAKAVKALIANGTIPQLLDPGRAHLLPQTGALRRLPIVLAWEAAYARLAYAAARRCLTHLRTRAVVAAKCQGVEMSSLLAAAGDLGLPSVFLPHGLYADDPSWHRIPATLVLADGPYLAEILASRGHPPEALAIVGPPKYDSALSARQAGREPLCRQLGLDPAHRFVCVAATGECQFALAACAALVQEAPARGWRLLVKLHPRFSGPHARRDLQQAAGPQAQLFSDVDPLLLYAVSDLVVTGVSTSAFEAMLVGTPVVYMGNAEEEVYGYVTSGAAAHAPDAARLPQVVAEVLESPARPSDLIARGCQFVASHLAPLDGGAAERCARTARALADGATIAQVLADLARASGTR